MAKKGTQYTCPKKQFAIPADLKALGNSANPIISAIRQWTASIQRKANKEG